MAKNTSILLGDYFENFISEQVASGRYASASEVVRAGLRILDEDEKQKIRLAEALEEGERSGFVENFDRHEFLAELHRKYVDNK